MTGRFACVAWASSPQRGGAVFRCSRDIIRINPLGRSQFINFTLTR